MKDIKQRIEQGLVAKLSLHIGRALLQVASAYPTLRKVIAEATQNALDANASKIIINVNLKDHKVTIQDNGDGVSEESFNEAIRMICESRKLLGTDQKKLGRFGIGLIAGLGKCREFCFISRPKGRGKFKQWTFNTSDIQECADEIDIPVIDRVDLNHNTPFSSLIIFTGIKQDRFISAITASELADEIKHHYNKALLRLGTVVSITLTDVEGNIETVELEGERFSGRKVNDQVLTTAHGAAVIFNIYIASRKPGLKPPGIVVGEIGSDHTFPFSDFVDSTAEWFTSNPDCLKALKSGLLTGEILGDGVKLHTNRRQFEANEALGEFCCAISTWYTNTGKAIIESERSELKDCRFQDIGRDVLQKLEEIIPGFKQIKTVLESANFGSIGRGHAIPNSGKVLDETLPFNALGSTNAKGEGNSRTGRNDMPHENVGHIPNIATGPRGERRNRVRGSNSGLVIHFEASTKSLWDFDPPTATLTFNVAHPSWQELEHSDEALAEMQLTIALLVLNMEGYRSDTTLYAWADQIVPEDVKLLLAVIGIKYPKKKKK